MPDTEILDAFFSGDPDSIWSIRDYLLRCVARMRLDKSDDGSVIEIENLPDIESEFGDQNTTPSEKIPELMTLLIRYMASLCIATIVHQKWDIFALLRPIFNPMMPVHQVCGADEHDSSNIARIVLEETNKPCFAECVGTIETLSDPPLEVFEFFFEIGEYMTGEQFYGPTVAILYKFTTYILEMSKEHFNNLDEKLLESILNQIVKTLQKHREIFDFADELCDILTKCLLGNAKSQLIGSRIFYQMDEAGVFADPIKKWVERSNIDEDLLSKDLPVTLIRDLSRIISKFVMIKDSVIQLVDIACNKHVAERLLLFEIAVNAMKDYDHDAVHDVMIQLTEHSYASKPVQITEFFGIFGSAFAKKGVTDLIPEMANIWDIEDESVMATSEGNRAYVGAVDAILRSLNEEYSRSQSGDTIQTLLNFAYSVLSKTVDYYDNIPERNIRSVNNIMEMIYNHAIGSVYGKWIIDYITKCGVIDQFYYMVDNVSQSSEITLFVIKMINFKVMFANVKWIQVKGTVATVASDAPPDVMEIDSLFDALVKSKTERTAECVANMIAMYYKRSPLQAHETAKIIQTKVCDYLERDIALSHKKYMIILAWEFLKATERWMELEDCSADIHRHGKPRTKRNAVHFWLMINHERRPIQMKAKATVGALKTRAAILSHRDTSAISLCINGVELQDMNLSLLAAGVVEMTTVTVSVNNYAREVLYSLPSIAMRGRFADSLLNICTTVTDKSLTSWAWKVLQFLPTSNQFKDLLTNAQDYCRSIIDADSDFTLTYLFQARESNAAKLDGIAKYIDEPFVEKIVGKLETFDMAALGICSFMSAFFTDLYCKFEDRIVQRLLPMMVKRDNLFLVKSAHLITLLAKHATSMITASKYHDLFASVIKKTDEFTWKIILDMMTALRDQSYIFHLCLKELAADEQEWSYFAALARQILHETDIDYDKDAVMDQLLDLAERKSGKTLFYLTDMLAKVSKIVSREYPRNVMLQRLASIAFNGDSQSTTSMLLDRILEQKSSLPNISSLFEVKCDVWNHDPNHNAKSATGLVGIRNFKFTCYLNSVFQQLFAIRPFVYALLSETFEDPAMVGMQAIFARLAVGKRPFVDPSPFTSTWKGWDGKIIDTGVQQDAAEFFAFLMDGLPASVSSMFQGKIVDIIEGIENPFRQETTSDFISLSVPIKGFADLMESFDMWSRPQILSGENMYSTSDMGLIEAKKYQRIEKAPEVLVIQLNRFEYDITTTGREKITSRCEYPKHLNMSKLMVDKNSDENYTLSGVICHRGDGSTGHYCAIVKSSTMNAWIKVSDQEITVLNGSLETETFGGRQNINEVELDVPGEAYLLFYVRDNWKFAYKGDVLSPDEFANIRYDIHPDLAGEIEKENTKFVNIQAMTLPLTYNFVKEVDNWWTTVVYYFNIFIHTSLSDKSKSIVNLLTKQNVLDNRPTRIIEYVISRWDDIVMVFRSIAPIAILDGLKEVLSQAIFHADVDVGGKLITRITGTLIDCIEKPRALQPLLQIVATSLASRKPLLVNVARTDDMTEMTTELFAAIIEKKSRIDTSQLVGIITMVMSPHTSLKYYMKMGNFILAQENSSCFIEKAVRLGKISPNLYRRLANFNSDFYIRSSIVPQVQYADVESLSQFVEAFKEDGETFWRIVREECKLDLESFYVMLPNLFEYAMTRDVSVEKAADVLKNCITNEWSELQSFYDELLSYKYSDRVSNVTAFSVVFTHVWSLAKKQQTDKEAEILFDLMRKVDEKYTKGIADTLSVFPPELISRHIKKEYDEFYMDGNISANRLAEFWRIVAHCDYTMTRDLFTKEFYEQIHYWMRFCSVSEKGSRVRDNFIMLLTKACEHDTEFLCLVAESGFFANWFLDLLGQVDFLKTIGKYAKYFSEKAKNELRDVIKKCMKSSDKKMHASGELFTKVDLTLSLTQSDMRLTREEVLSKLKMEYRQEHEELVYMRAVRSREDAQEIRIILPDLISGEGDKQRASQLSALYIRILLLPSFKYEPIGELIAEHIPGLCETELARVYSILEEAVDSQKSTWIIPILTKFFASADMSVPEAKSFFVAALTSAVARPVLATLRRSVEHDETKLCHIDTVLVEGL